MNGVSLPERKNWWLDPSIGEYPLTGLVKPGGNHIALRYQITRKQQPLREGENETATNRFFFPVEPAAVYIRGNFDVLAQSGFVRRNGSYGAGEHYALGGPFCLAPGGSLSPHADLTAQNRWFYRGDAEYAYTIEMPAVISRRISIAVKKYSGAAIVWRINEHEGCLFTSPLEQDITDCLKPGRNRLTLRLAGTNRNVMGPHHHSKGEPKLTGPSSFRGACGVENFPSPELWV